MVKGNVSFIGTVNRLEVTASHPKFLTAGPFSLLPNAPVDS